MDQLRELFTTHENELAAHIREQADKHGFAQNINAQGKAWGESVGLTTQALVGVLDQSGLDGCQLTPGGTCLDPSLERFALDAARVHRERGVSLAMFMGMLKLYRIAYVDLIQKEVNNPGIRDSYRSFVNRFFDRVEIAQCVDWARSEEERKLAELAETHRAVAEEKNRFLTLFDSLSTPVFLLDAEQHIQIMNRAAGEFLGGIDLPESLLYARLEPSDDRVDAPDELVALSEAVSWLANELDHSCPFDGSSQECRFDVTTTIAGRVHHFNISVSSMADVSERFTGTAVVMDDITHRVAMEKQLVYERNMAAHYLDLVGSIVVALDASGGIMLINRTGCDILGYENMELVGQNWIDMVIPPEERYELREYFHEIVTGQAELDEEHVNYVTTKSGDLRLVEWKNRLLTNEDGHAIGILSSGMDVTQQREMEDALAEKELWLRNTFVALGEAVLILSPDSKIIDANPAAETMFQLTNQEICDIPVEQLHVDRAHDVEFGEIVQAAFDRGEDANFEFSMRRRDGEVFPTEHSVAVITGDDGSVLGTVSAIRDISKRKQAERELRQSEEKFRRIFETIEEGYVVTDMEGTIQMVNPATCSLLGYNAACLIGEDMGTLYASADERKRLRHILATKGVVHGMHLTASRKDGSIIVVEANAHVVRGEDGNPAGMEGTFRDITARIEADKMLREREKQYRAFFENNHAVMLLEDPQDGKIVDANPAAGEFYGYSVEEMRSMNMSQISEFSEEEVFQEMATARKEKRAYFIFRHKLASGDVRDVEVYSGPILVRGNQLLYSVIHDVTDRIRLEQDMKHMATTDALTGANNRHQFFQLAGQELKRSRRYSNELAVLMLDIDYFKSINDTYGHQAGDVVLRALTAMAQATLRESDIFGRLGGEEFAAILPETPLLSALQVAERLREELSKLSIRSKNEDISFTVSIGVSIATKQDRAIEDVLNRADEALYKAKRGGRNRVEKG